MSQQLIARNPDLQRLRNEGYHLEIRGGYLLVKDVPYVNGQCAVKRGILITTLDFNGDVTVPPSSHVAMWTGEHPCHHDGRKITAIENGSAAQDLGDGIRADFTFSAKAAYRDFHHKVTTYIGRIAGEAAVLETVTAQTFPVYADDTEQAVFNYIDTASSRADLGALNDRLAHMRIAIVGLGGTGSFVLDLVAKTTVREIHLFDGDRYSSHNAFRAPGATSLDQLRAGQQKVHHWAEVYSRMRKGVHAHNVFVSDENVELLAGFDFVFLCIDADERKPGLIDGLERLGLAFIDTGLGVVRGDQGSLSGIVRVSTSTPQNRQHARRHIAFGSSDARNEYSTNIQVVELNAANALMAVIKWKKLCGFYRDSSSEYYACFSIAANDIVNESGNDD
jgi:molybdopterin/thiamine biosynthesis adenylyltransferase